MNARLTVLIRRLATAGLLAALAAGLRAASPDAPIAALDPARPLTRLDRRTWNLDHDVFLGTVKAMLQGRDGYLWLGTDAGLVRFDGVRFVNFDTRNTPALRSNFIHALAEDPAGNLWLGTSGGGVSRLDPVTGRWQTWSVPEGLPSDTLNSLAVDPADGSVWLGTRAGLVHFRDGRFTTYGKDAGIGVAAIWALTFDRAGQLWAGTADGLCRREGERFHRFGVADGLPNAVVLSLAVDARGDLWVGTRVGLARVRPGGGEATTAFEVVPLADPAGGVPEDAVYALRGDRAGSLWLGGPAGVKRRGPDGAVSLLSLADHFPGANVGCFLDDAEGNLWVGTTDGGGLTRLKLGKFDRLTAADGLPDNQVYQFARDPAGRVWIATRRGLGCWWPEDNRVHRVTLGPEVDGRGVGALFVDREGFLWFAVGNGGEVCRLDPAHPDRPPLRGNVGPGAENLRVRAIAEDAAGRLWLAATEGLRELRRADGTPRRPAPDTAAATLADTYTQFLHLDARGNLWVGALDRGLVRLAPDGRTARTWRVADGLPSDKVWCVHEDARGDGTLWVGSPVAGLIRLAPDGRVSGVCRAADGLEDDMVLGIVEDDAGNLWLNRDRGFLRVAKSELEDFFAGRRPRVTGTAYGVDDGLPTTFVASNGTPLSLREPGPGGRLWFPTARGAVFAAPGRLPVNAHPPPVRIETLAADGRAVDLFPADPDAGPVRIAPGAGGRLDFAFTAPSLTVPEKVRFRYRLTPFETNWTEETGTRTARYTNLPPRAYTFEVLAANEDGAWSPAPASLGFRLLPRFYQTAWFAGLCALGVAGLTVGAYCWRQRHLRREFAAVLAERGRLARELHDTLAQGLIAAGLQLERAGRPRSEGGTLPGAVEHHLQTAHHIIRQTLGEARALVASLHGRSPTGARNIAELAATLRMLVAELGVRAGGTNLHFQEGLPAACRKRTLPAEAAAGFVLICREALTNAIKHAEARSIRLELSAPGPDRLGATVSDDGVGFDPAATSPSAASGDGVTGGFGLRSMREHADALGAALSVRSTPGSGTKVLVEIAIPVGMNVRSVAPGSGSGWRCHGEREPSGGPARFPGREPGLNFTGRPHAGCARVRPPFRAVGGCRDDRRARSARAPRRRGGCSCKARRRRCCSPPDHPGRGRRGWKTGGRPAAAGTRPRPRWSGRAGKACPGWRQPGASGRWPGPRGYAPGCRGWA